MAVLIVNCPLWAALFLGQGYLTVERKRELADSGQAGRQAGGHGGRWAGGGAGRVRWKGRQAGIHLCRFLTVDLGLSVPALASSVMDCKLEL